MTDDEFERIKAAEKGRLRAQARRSARQGRAEGIVVRMARGIERLLAETDALIERLRAAEGHGRSASVLEEEDADREERAERLVRQGRTAREGPLSTRPAGAPETRDEPEGPAKTIGRMRQPRADAPSIQDRRDGGD